MSYATMWACQADQAFQNRVIAACAAEGDPDPSQALSRVIWPVCTAADVEAAYASALAAGNENPGGDETVVTDSMILSHVQAALGP